MYPFKKNKIKNSRDETAFKTKQNKNTKNFKKERESIDFFNFLSFFFFSFFFFPEKRFNFFTKLKKSISPLLSPLIFRKKRRTKKKTNFMFLFSFDLLIFFHFFFPLPLAINYYFMCCFFKKSKTRIVFQQGLFFDVVSFNHVFISDLPPSFVQSNNDLPFSEIWKIC